MDISSLRGGLEGLQTIIDGFITVHLVCRECYHCNIEYSADKKRPWGITIQLLICFDKRSSKLLSFIRSGEGHGDKLFDFSVESANVGDNIKAIMATDG